MGIKIYDENESSCMIGNTTTWLFTHRVTQPISDNTRQFMTKWDRQRKRQHQQPPLNLEAKVKVSSPNHADSFLGFLLCPLLLGFPANSTSLKIERTSQGLANTNSFIISSDLMFEAFLQQIIAGNTFRVRGRLYTILMDVKGFVVEVFSLERQIDNDTTLFL